MSFFVGGDDVADMLFAHHAQGASLRTLAARHRTSHQTVKRKLRTGGNRLRVLGMFPKSWERPRRIRAKTPVTAENHA